MTNIKTYIRKLLYKNILDLKMDTIDYNTQCLGYVASDKRYTRQIRSADYIYTSGYNIDSGPPPCSANILWNISSGIIKINIKMFTETRPNTLVADVTLGIAYKYQNNGPGVSYYTYELTSITTSVENYCFIDSPSGKKITVKTTNTNVLDNLLNRPYAPFIVRLTMRKSLKGGYLEGDEYRFNLQGTCQLPGKVPNVQCSFSRLEWSILKFNSSTKPKTENISNLAYNINNTKSIKESQPSVVKPPDSDPVIFIQSQLDLSGSDIADSYFSVTYNNSNYNDYIKYTQFVTVLKGKGNTYTEKVTYLWKKYSNTLEYDSFLLNISLYVLLTYFLSKLLYGKFSRHYVLSCNYESFLCDLSESQYKNFSIFYTDPSSPIYGYNSYML